MTGEEFKTPKISILRHNKGIKEVSVQIAGKTYGFAAVNGLKNLAPLLEEINKGTKKLHFVEVMACKNGCIAGGGQPVNVQNESVKSRLKSFYEEDEKASIKIPAKNQLINDLFSEAEGVRADKIRKAVTTCFSRKQTF
jgi:iron only hydrogenase large subunit-like protein